MWLFQTYALENAEGSEIKECRPEETGVGGTIGGETTEAAEGVRYTVRYVQTRGHPIHFLKENITQSCTEEIRYI